MNSLNNIIDYTCVNDYSNFVPNLSTTNMRPAESYLLRDNYFLFDRPKIEKHRVGNDNDTQDIDNGPASNYFKQRLSNPQNYNNDYLHKNHVSRCNSSKMFEGFENTNTNQDLINIIPTINRRLDESNRNMKMILETDSSLEDLRLKELQKAKLEDDKKYIAIQEQQNKKLQKINKLLTDIEVLRVQALQEYGSLRSIQSTTTGKKLSVDTVDQNGTILIRGNNQCISFNGDNQYDLTECNPKSKQQHFTMTPISNDIDFHRVLENPNQNTGDIKYPFYVVQPKGHNTTCLQAGVEDDSTMLSIEPCSKSEQQKWRTLHTKLNCNTR
jgi:hypothetical protein